MAVGDIKIKVDDFLTQTRVDMCGGKKVDRQIYICECKNYSIKEEGHCYIGHGSRSKAAQQGRAIKARQARTDDLKKMPPRPAVGKTLEIQYFRKISNLIDPYFADVKNILLPAIPEIVEAYNRDTRVDSERLDQTYGELITRRIRNISLGIGIQVTLPRIKIAAEDQARNTSEFQKRQLTRQVATVLGINPIFAEPYLESQVTAFVERNAALIKDIPAQSIARMETKLRTGIERGESSKDLRETVMSELGVAKNRAKLIARDQTQKFMSSLNELRQKELGVKGYVWSTSQDERVRPSHREKHGKEYSWDKPPSDTGHPGQDIACRCVALPIL